MKSKILCLILIVAVVCSVFVISASAEEGYVIEAGTYRWNDTLSNPNYMYGLVEEYSLSSTLTFNFSFDVSNNSLIEGVLSTSLDTITLDYDESGFYLRYTGVDFDDISFYGDENKWNNLAEYYRVAGFSNYELAYGAGQIITITSDQYVPTNFGIWFNDNTERQDVIDTGVLSAGSYMPSGDFLDISAFSWINSGDFVYFNANGYIIQDFNTGTRFSQIGITYTEIDANAYVLQLSALVDTSVGQAFQPFVTFTYSPNGNVIYWHNDNFANAHGIYFDYDVVLPTDILNIFLVFFDEFEQVYTGNVWYDIIDNVVEALQVDVFGYFSPWDILTTFIGLAIFLWLLKALAGG